jgi:hypothetical protein
MTGWNPPPGPQGPRPEQPAGDQPGGQSWLPGGSYPPGAGSPSAFPSPSGFPPPPGSPPPAPLSPAGRHGGRPGVRRSRTRLWLGLGGAAGLVVIGAVVAAVVIAQTPPAAISAQAAPGGAPSGTPVGTQLEQLLPSPSSLPSGWYLTYTPAASAAFLTPGKQPPVPIDQCIDFNAGFDLGVAGDTFVSSASETGQFGAGAGDGFLRIDLFGVLPGDADLAIKAVSTWVARCSSYTTSSTFGGLPITIGYTVTAASVPGLGSQSLDVRVTQHLPAGDSTPPTDNNTLLVRVGNELIAIECQAPPSSMINSLAALAAPMARKLPSASALPTSGPATKPKPTPAASPNLSASQLNRLLPTTSGLPAEYYQGNPATPIDWPNPGNVPLIRPPTALSCSQLINLTTGGYLNQYDVNYRVIADLSELDPNSNSLEVAIDEVTTESLASSDLTALKTAAEGCRQFSWTAPGGLGDVQTYDTTVTSVPGLGDANVDVRMNAVSASSGWDVNGPAEILMVQVGAAIVLVDYYLSLPEQTPDVASIAQPIVGKL